MVDYVLELRTVQTHVIKTLIEALKEILTDAQIELNTNGIRLIAMNPLQTILVHLKLDNFEEYKCTHKTMIGINMVNFHKIIKTISTNDTLSIYIEENNLNLIKIVSENAEKNTITRYELNLIDLNEKEIDIKPQTYPSIITMPAVDFQKICKDMSNFSETIEIKSIGTQLIFSCKGEFAKQETIFNKIIDSKNNDSDVSHKSSDVILQGYYNLRNLVLLCKFTTLCQSLNIYMKNDAPLMIEFNVGSLGTLKMVLAPKTEINN